MDFRLKNILFMLEVVYRENSELHDLAEMAMQQIIDLLEELDTELLRAIDALPIILNTNITVEYSHPKNIEMSCTTPQAQHYITLLQNFDLLVQQCDLLWLTKQWEREESREPIRYWSRAISRGLYRCAGFFLPLRRKYIEFQKLQHNTDDETPKTDNQS